MLNLDDVTRIEVIEEGKRKYVKWDCQPVFMLQDGGKTLKIFIDGKLVEKLEKSTKKQCKHRYADWCHNPKQEHQEHCIFYLVGQNQENCGGFEEEK